MPCPCKPRPNEALRRGCEGWRGAAMRAGRSGAFPGDLVQRIKDASGIVDIVGQFVTLKQAGQNLKGLCPFHAEKTPSFTVNPGKQVFHCFGCGAGGDVIEFLERHEKLSFPDAVRHLAERAGIRLPTSEAREDSETQKLIALHEAARSFFSVSLSSPLGLGAREYLAGRGVPVEMQVSFGVGFAPPAWDALIGHLRGKGFSADWLVKGGLAVPRNSGQGVYDRFRNRIIFPIVDASGRTIAFGGRSMDDSPPKYLNSPETAIYKKGDHLYGLYQAREAIRRRGAALLVEGYFDVIGAHAAGFDHAVATLGTALTTRQVGQLRRMAPDVVFVYDGDAAGLRAMRSSAGLLLESGAAVNVAVLPEGEDPDSFLQKEGPDAFGKAVGSSIRLADFVLESLIQEKRGSSAWIVEQMFSIWDQIANPIERGERIRRAAERLDIREEWIIEAWHASRQKPGGPGRPSAISPPGGPSAHGEAGQGSVRGGSKMPVRVEPLFLQILLMRPDLIPTARDRVSPDLWEDAALRAAYSGLLEGGGHDASDPAVGRLLVVDLPGTPEQVEAAFQDCIRVFVRRRQRIAQRRLYGEIRKAESSGDPEALKTSLREHMKVSKETCP